MDASFSIALGQRLACYFFANENPDLAKLDSQVWLRLWQLRGDPDFRTGTLFDSYDRNIRMLVFCSLESAEIGARSMRSNRANPFRLNFSNDLDRALSNPLAFECILRGEPGRLNSLGIELLEEVVGGQVNAFQYAAALGNVECFKVLIRRLGFTSPLLVTPDGKLNSEVLCCCDARFPFGHRGDLLNLLLSQFALDSFGPKAVESFLKTASYFGAPWMLSLVFSHWPKAEKKKLTVCLFWACIFGHADCIPPLLEQGADRNYVSGGRSLLTFSTQKGHVDCVRLLLEHGADVNATDAFGITALMLATAEGYAEIARVLREHGATE